MCLFKLEANKRTMYAQINTSPLTPLKTLTMWSAHIATHLNAVIYHHTLPREEQAFLWTNMDDRPSPIYKGLDTNSLQIRLLYLEPCGRDDQVVTCRITTASLSTDPQYYALSYVWGDPKPTDDIILNGRPFRIANSLAAALKHLRATALFADRTALPVWIDAVCINQADIAERSQQVAIMGSIYSSAECVLSWLGEPDRGGRYVSDAWWTGDEEQAPMSHGFPLIRAVSRYIDSRREDGALGWNDGTVLIEQDFQWMAQNPDFYDSDSERLAMNLRWNAIIKINRATYWTRIWIIQEMALASSPHKHLIFCGAEYVSYQQLNDLHEFLQKVQDQRPARPSFVPVMLWGILAGRNNMTFTMMHWVNYLREASSDASARIVPHVSQHCSCTEPRDAVYGLLAVVANSVVPDYSKPVAQVYQDWFADSLRRRRSSNLMAWSGIGHGFTNSLGIPSWIPVLHELSEKAHDSGMIRDLRSAEVDPWLDTLQLEPPRIIGDGLLSIHGVLLETVSEVDFPLQEDPTHERFARFCADFSTRYSGRKYKTGLFLLEAVFAVLFQGYDSIKKKKLVLPLEPANVLALAFRLILMPAYTDTSQEAEDLKRTVDGNLFDVEDKEAKRSWMEAYDSAADSREVLDGMRTLFNYLVLFGKHAFFLTHNGYLGIGPPRMNVGDRICLVQESNFPSLLRKVGPHWAYVGTCYVQGLSDGEPLQMINAKEVEVEDLILE